jgi:hypothetical protein
LSGAPQRILVTMFLRTHDMMAYINQKKIEDYWYYIRIYEDSTIITVSSIGTPKDISSWFRRENIENNGIGHGRFELQDGYITFASTSTNGTVEYKGTIEGRIMYLDAYSHINGQRDKREYRYVKVSLN